MRYGIIRDAAFLPPPSEQRAALEALKCDVIVQERGSAPEGNQRINRLLYSVKPGDDVVVHSLAVFLKSAGEVVRTIRTLLEIGARLIVASPIDKPRSIESSEPVLELLSLLVEHESVRVTATPPRARGRIGGGSRRPLSTYQIDYARKLHADGVSLRAIGLLFQLSPEDVWQVIGG